MSFGSYLRMLRKKQGIRQADLAKKIGVTPVYVCDIENDRRYPPDFKRLLLWVEQMSLSEEESEKLFDLAGIARKSVPPDIGEYLTENPDALKAIRRIIEKEENYDWDVIPG